MAKQRTKNRAATQIEELPQPQEELTAEQAEAVEGGILSLTSPPLSTSGVLMPDKPDKPPKVEGWRWQIQ